MTHSDDLPQQPKHEVRLSGVQILRSDVDDVAADGARRVERECEVLVHLVDAHLPLVDRALVDRVRACAVDQLATKRQQTL